ncbi:MAG: hypothetical protein KA116_08205 [Proteobacteria bacterium]|nr:hypothetical protein [Pseudomonadota bacterium]
MRAIQSLFLLSLCFSVSHSFSSSFLAVPSTASATILDSKCERFLLTYSEQWRPVLRAGLEGLNMEVAAQELSGSSLYSGDQKHNGILDRAIADELMFQGVKSPQQIRLVILAFPALESSKKIEFLEYVAERIVNALETKLEVGDLVAIDAISKKFGMQVEDYLRFLNYWKRNYALDPALSELKFAILYHLVNEPALVAQRISKLRGPLQRFRDYWTRRKVLTRASSPLPLYENFDVEFLKQKSNMGDGDWHYLQSISLSGRDYFIRKNIKAMSLADLVLANQFVELTDSTRELVKSRLDILGEISKSYWDKSQSIKDKIQANQSRIQEINKSVVGFRPAPIKPISGDAWEAVKEAARVLDRLAGEKETNQAISAFFKTHGPNLNATQFVELFFIFAAEVKRYGNISPTIAGFQILLDNSMGLDINEKDVTKISREIVSQSTAFTKYPESLAQALAIAHGPWGKKVSKLDADSIKKLEAEKLKLLKANTGLEKQLAPLKEEAKQSLIRIDNPQ